MLGAHASLTPGARPLQHLLHPYQTRIGILRSILADPFHSRLLHPQQKPLCLIDHFPVILDVAHLLRQVVRFGRASPSL